MPNNINGKFELINTHDDYVEFVISYVIERNYWRASGIGWIKKSSPKYYLRLLRLNGVPVSDLDYKKALVSLKNSSYKFKDKTLDALAISNIEKIFKIKKR